MNIIARICKTVEEIFDPFQYHIDSSLVSRATCIAHENFGGYDSRTVYEIYVDNKPRFFIVSIREIPEGDSQEAQYLKGWTRSSDVLLVGTNETGYLFEVKLPFGIQFRNS